MKKAVKVAKKKKNTRKRKIVLSVKRSKKKNITPKPRIIKARRKLRMKRVRVKKRRRAPKAPISQKRSHSEMERPIAIPIPLNADTSNLMMTETKPPNINDYILPDVYKGEDANHSLIASLTADTEIWNIINAALPPGYTIPDPAFVDICKKTV